ncbi:hypothetical protein GCM10028818_41980 [Spirosoma horti]
MEIERKGFQRTGSRRFLQAYVRADQEVQPTIDELKKLVSDNPSQLKRIYRLESLIKTWLNFWQTQDAQTAKAGSRQDDRYGIVERITREKTYTDVIHAEVNQIKQVEQTLLDRRQKENDLSVERSTYELLLCTLLTLVIVAGLIYSTVRESSQNRKSKALLQHNFKELEQLNALGSEKNWLLTGLSAVNDQLQDITDTSSLAQSILQTLTTYLSLPASAFYCFNEAQQELQLNASVALPEQVKQSYQLGNGLVGQAALSRSMTLINDVPAHYWVIQAGSGQALPGQIVCMPLWYNQELKGVLELASFKPLDQQSLQLLKSTANNIAVAINAADGHAKIMNLLKTVHEQKEELSTQQEALRLSNEELQQQAEELQASEEEMKVHEEELRAINAELYERNGIIEVARQDLSAKAEELEANSKYKSEFLANMSHELRTPLNSVLILARLLAENKSCNLTDKQVQYATVIHKSGTDLLDLINDILDLSKIEAGKIELCFEEVPLAGIARDMSQLFNVVAQEKGVQLLTRLSESVPAMLRTDRQRIGQIIKNLLSNAFKFTPAGGSVTLLFDLEEQISNDPQSSQQRVAIAVADTGIGIAPEKQQLIFEAFQQADGSTSRKFGGTGLGLSISKELIHKLGGELRLQSEPGKGSTFIIYLPVDSSDSVVFPPINDQPVKVVATPVRIPQTIDDDRHNLQPGDRVILIMEDDPIFAGIVQDFFRQKKYRTIVATRGDEGIECARYYKPAALILDIGLPVVNGWDVLKILKEDDSLKHIPVHVISAMEKPPSSDVLSYKTKPIEPKELEGLVDLISKQLKEGSKKVLLLSGYHLNADSIKSISNKRHAHLQCDYAGSIEQAKQLINQRFYDCLIVDIGNQVEQGLLDLRGLLSTISPRQLPIIIYLDKDLTAEEERELNTISPILIRNSLLAKNRLMDELDLFFNKVQSGHQRSLPLQASPNPLNQGLQGRKVLVVDDDMRNVFALSTLLESQQIQVVTATDGLDALDLLQEHADTDLVLMDVMMPTMDGYEATRRIRQDQRFLNLPIIALTAKAMLGDHQKCIEAGASDYITKPVNTTQLISLMQVWLSR